MGTLARHSVRIGTGFMDSLLNRGQRPGALKIKSIPYCYGPSICALSLCSFPISLHYILAGKNSVLAAKESSSNMAFSPFTSYTNGTKSEMPSEKNSPGNIVWVDCEMTGLDPDKDHVLEIACLVTDSQLNIIAEGPDITIHQPPEVLEKMNEWCIRQHKESGLTVKCQQSEITLREAEKQLLEFVREWTPFKKCPLGGNTIYMDRLFLMKHMPDFEQHMHYRIIDVSSIKELCSRWYADPKVCIAKLSSNSQCTHRAMDDIKASVEMLKYYKRTLFVSNDYLEKANDDIGFY